MLWTHIQVNISSSSKVSIISMEKHMTRAIG